MKVIWNSLTFFRVQRVPDGLITTDQILQSTGNKWNQSCTIEIGNEDDIGIVEVLDSNKATADKALF